MNLGIVDVHREARLFGAKQKRKEKNLVVCADRHVGYVNMEILRVQKAI